jgi:sRNA-binding protein
MTSTQPPPAPEPLTASALITGDRNSEARRAYRESRAAILLLQQRWPAAFPETPQQVRPLITGLTPLIAAALGWSHPYTRAVLRTWKLRPACCHAVLAHPIRVDLNGNPTDQPVDEDARIRAGRGAVQHRQQSHFAGPAIPLAPHYHGRIAARLRPGTSCSARRRPKVFLTLS